MDNGKKEYAENGVEEDITSRYSRKLYCYIKNTKGLTKWVKRKMNKRFRKRWKSDIFHL
jgi:uncharacterized protein YgiM (DUF1202 family)